jgi:hypothetical protein
MMRKLCNAFLAALVVVALGVPAARAQQSPDQQQTPAQQQSPDQQQAPNQNAAPIPAYRSPLASDADQSGSDSQLTPDDRSLSGAEDLSPEMLSTRSYWQPRFDVFGTADSNPIEVPSGNDWTGGAAVSGRVDVHRISGNSAMNLSYDAGGIFSTDSGVSNGIVQALSFADKFTFRRSSLSFMDQLSYLPGSAFGFGGLGGLGGSLGGGLSPVFGPGQTILTGEGQDLGNSFVTEFDMSLTPRSSFTLVGGYYLLHNFNGDLLNSGNPNFRGGYNYQLSPKNTVAVFYTYSGFLYNISSENFSTHTAQVSYGRLLTGRLSFQVAAGPQIIISRSQFAGSEAGTVTAAPTTQLNWALNSSLTWAAGRNRFGLAYYRGANSGSGVLVGSIGDTVTGSITREVSRTFSSGITGGYSRNNGVAFFTETPLNQTYDYWYGSASLSHPVGRSLGLTLSYLVQYQNSNTSFCTGPTCGTSIIRNLISFGVGWHERPLLF